MKIRIEEQYFIDGNKLKQLLHSAKVDRDSFFSRKMFESAQRQQGMIDILDTLLDELHPLKPLAEKCFESGEYCEKENLKLMFDYPKDRFLNSEIEL